LGLALSHLPIQTNWHGEIERCPFAEFAFEPDFSALEFDKIFRDTQSKPSAGRFTHFVIRRAKEFAENFCWSSGIRICK
jgi:hypothetical protein